MQLPHKSKDLVYIYYMYIILPQLINHLSLVRTQNVTPYHTVLTVVVYSLIMQYLILFTICFGMHARHYLLGPYFTRRYFMILHRLMLLTSSSNDHEGPKVRFYQFHTFWSIKSSCEGDTLSKKLILGHEWMIILIFALDCNYSFMRLT